VQIAYIQKSFTPTIYKEPSFCRWTTESGRLNIAKSTRESRSILILNREKKTRERGYSSRSISVRSPQPWMAQFDDRFRLRLFGFGDSEADPCRMLIRTRRHFSSGTNGLVSHPSRPFRELAQRCSKGPLPLPPSSPSPPGRLVPFKPHTRGGRHCGAACTHTAGVETRVESG